MLYEEMDELNITYEVVEKGQIQRIGVAEDSSAPFSPVIDVAAVNEIPVEHFTEKFIDMLKSFIIEKDEDALWTNW